jgi:tetratricopeptide (TPR) repeat protein
MWQASRVAVLAASLALAQAPPPATAPAKLPLFDRLSLDYEAGRFDVVAKTIKTPADLNALQPELNAALTTRDEITRMRVMFLLEVAAVVAEQKWSVPPAKGAPTFFEQVGLLWIRRPPDAAPPNDEFTRLFNKTIIALMERIAADWTTPIDNYADALEARFDRGALNLKDRRALEARCNLARAMAAELVSIRPRSQAATFKLSGEVPVLSRYKKAMAAPDALPETFVRGALNQLRSGRAKDAIATLDQFQDPKDDPALTYWAWLFRGRALAELDRPSEADVAYRKALAAWPHAQSAAAGLTSLYMFWNNPSEAQRWSIAMTTAPADAVDPWWFYPEGDYRFLPKWLASLREAAR